MLNHTKLINRIIASMFIVHCLWRQNQYNKLEVRLTNWFVSIMRFLYMVYRHNCANKIMCTNISDEYRLIFTFSKRHIHFVCLWRVFVARVMQIGKFASLFLYYFSILCFVCGIYNSHTFTTIIVDVDSQNYTLRHGYMDEHENFEFYDFPFNEHEEHDDSTGFFLPHIGTA